MTTIDVMAEVILNDTRIAQKALQRALWQWRTLVDDQQVFLIRTKLFEIWTELESLNSHLIYIINEEDIFSHMEKDPSDSEGS